MFKFLLDNITGSKIIIKIIVIKINDNSISTLLTLWSDSGLLQRPKT